LNARAGLFTDVRLASMRTDDALHSLRLLQLFDSQFPVGAFAHSGGLETYAQAGADIAALHELLIGQIDLGWGQGDLCAASLAWQRANGVDARTELERLSTLVGAYKVVPSVRDASVRLGRRTLALLRRLHHDTMRHFDVAPPHHPIVIGAAGRLLDLNLRELLLAYAHNLAAGTLAAAMRCMPVSPVQAQVLLTELQPRLASAVNRSLAASDEGLFTCTPALDVRCHQQALLHTRLFQS
jgi:urease accessory protein